MDLEIRVQGKEKKKKYKELRMTLGLWIEV